MVYSVQDIARLFDIRNQLVVEVNGTGVAAGLCGYRRKYNTYPEDAKMTYTESCPKRSDTDQYDKVLARFGYKLLTEKQSLDTANGRIWIEMEDKECLLWSVGQDHEDNYAASHTDDGATGDIVIWPPIKALSRKKGLMK